MLSLLFSLGCSTVNTLSSTGYHGVTLEYGDTIQITLTNNRAVLLTNSSFRNVEFTYTGSTISSSDLYAISFLYSGTYTVKNVGSASIKIQVFILSSSDCTGYFYYSLADKNYKVELSYTFTSSTNICFFPITDGAGKVKINLDSDSIDSTSSVYTYISGNSVETQTKKTTVEGPFYVQFRGTATSSITFKYEQKESLDNGRCKGGFMPFLASRSISTHVDQSSKITQSCSTFQWWIILVVVIAAVIIIGVATTLTLRICCPTWFYSMCCCKKRKIEAADDKTNENNGLESEIPPAYQQYPNAYQQTYTSPPPPPPQYQQYQSPPQPYQGAYPMPQAYPQAYQQYPQQYPPQYQQPVEQPMMQQPVGQQPVGQQPMTQQAYGDTKQ